MANVSKIKIISKEQIEKDIAEWREKHKVNKTVLSFAWMDSYVIYFCNDKQIDEWSIKASDVPKVEKKKGGSVSNVKKVREMFLETFLPDLTDEAIEKWKEDEAKRKEAEKAEMERLKNLTPAEQLKLKLQKMKELANAND